MKVAKQTNYSNGANISTPEEEISRLKRTEAFSTSQRRVLELLAGDASLGSVLNSLIRSIEDQASGMVCSVLVFDPVTKCLHHGAAPSLPKKYTNAIDGVKIGEGVASCGTAAHRRQLVIVEDIETDPLWLDYRDLALKYNLHAAWSQPILSSRGNLLGTFAMYINKRQRPSGFELVLIDMAANLATIAIERKQTEQEIHEANIELKKARKNLKKAEYRLMEWEKKTSLGEFVAEIAHEINTPIGIGVTAASLLRDKTNEFDSSFQRGSMKKSDLINLLEVNTNSSEIILMNLQRASELIRSFKQIAVDEASQQKRVIKVNAYLHDILTSLRPKLKKTKHSIEIRCPEDIEYGSYPGALAQVMTNLIVNSLTHGYDEDDEGHIIIEVNSDNDYLVLRYSDDGKGIPEKFMDRIFDPFFTTTRAHGGSGLGLHVVHDLVSRKLKGTIECTSEMDQGTRFTITLPLRFTDTEVR